MDRGLPLTLDYARQPCDVHGWVRAHEALDCRRYVQLPINAAMPEAWKEKWQSMPAPALRDDGRLDAATPEGTVMGSLMEAAARLGVGIFASGPLQEGQLLGDRHLQVC